MPPCASQAKSSSGHGNGAGKGRGYGKGTGAAASSGGGGGKGASVTQMEKQLQALQKRFDQQDKASAKLLAEIKGKQNGKSQEQVKVKYWSCQPCGYDKNFLKKEACHSCGEAKQQAAGQAAAKAAAAAAVPQAARVPQPPGLEAATKVAAAAAAAEGPEKQDQAAMETEAVPVEQRIARLEAELKVLRQGSLPESKALVVIYEQALKAAREEQRLARPLPARYQAATDKLSKLKLQGLDLATKAKAIQVQAEAAAKLAQEKLHAVLKEGVEVAAKLAEAEQELAAVKADLAAGQQPAQAAGGLTVGPELIAGVCGYLAASVQGFQLSEQFMVDFAKFLLPAPAAGPAAPAAAPPAWQQAAAAEPTAATAPPAAASGMGAEATMPVSQAGAWAARELAAQELARVSFAMMVGKMQAQQAAAGAVTVQDQHRELTSEGAAGTIAVASAPGPLTELNVSRLGGTGSSRVRSSSRSEKRRLANANLSEAQQLALFAGGN